MPDGRQSVFFLCLNASDVRVMISGRKAYVLYFAWECNPKPGDPAGLVRDKAIRILRLLSDNTIFAWLFSIGGHPHLYVHEHPLPVSPSPSSFQISLAQKVGSNAFVKFDTCVKERVGR